MDNYRCIRPAIDAIGGDRNIHQGTCALTRGCRSVEMCHGSVTGYVRPVNVVGKRIGVLIIGSADGARAVSGNRRYLLCAGCTAGEIIHLIRNIVIIIFIT